MRANKTASSYLFSVVALLCVMGCSQEMRIVLEGDLGATTALYWRVVPDAPQNDGDITWFLREDGARRILGASLDHAASGPGRVEVFALGAAGCELLGASVPLDLGQPPAEISVRLQPETKRCLLGVRISRGVPDLRITLARNGERAVNAQSADADPQWLVPTDELLVLKQRDTELREQGVRCELDPVSETLPLDEPDQKLAGCRVSIRQKSLLTLSPQPRGSEPQLRVMLTGDPGSSSIYSLAETPGIRCGAQCTAYFPKHLAKLTVNTDPDHYFIGWSVPECGNSATCEISVTGPQSVSARFGKRICSAAALCWEHPLPQGNVLNAVHGVAPDQVWAVGEQGTILRFDGKTWSSEASGTTRDLRGVLAVKRESGVEVWAVGMSGIVLYRSPKTGSWSIQRVTAAAALNALWPYPQGNVLAVGDSGQVCTLSGLSAPVCLPQTFGGMNPNLIAAWVEDDNNLWAASNDGIWYSQSGGTWTASLRTPSMTRISGMAGRTLGKDRRLTALFENGELREKTNDEAWKIVPVQERNRANRSFLAAQLDAQGRVHALVRSTSQLPLVFHLDSDAWEADGVLAGPTPTPNAFWIGPEGAEWVVGSSGLMADLGRQGGAYQTLGSIATEEDLFDLHGLSSSSLAAVGGERTFLRREGSTGFWKSVPFLSATNGKNLQSVWEQPKDTYWISNGTQELYQLAKGTWSAYTIENMDARWGKIWADDSVLSVFNEKDGAMWTLTTMSKKSGPALCTMSGCAARALFADVESKTGGRYHYAIDPKGQPWRLIPGAASWESCPADPRQNINMDLFGLWMPDGGGEGVLAVGKKGGIYYQPFCKEWSQVPPPASEIPDLWSVYGTESVYVAVGDEGTVLRGSLADKPLQPPALVGTEPMTSRALHKVLIVSGPGNASDAYMVGARGVVLRYRIPISGK